MEIAVYIVSSVCQQFVLKDKSPRRSQFFCSCKSWDTPGCSSENSFHQWMFKTQNLSSNGLLSHSDGEQIQDKRSPKLTGYIIVNN